jgi:hypothetical protein
MPSRATPVSSPEGRRLSQCRWLPLLLSLSLLAACAPTPLPLQSHEVLRLDPGPIDGVSDVALEHAVHPYADQFAQTDVMAMGRDPTSPEVRYAAFRALLYHGWRQDPWPPNDPLRQHPQPPPAW